MNRAPDVSVGWKGFEAREVSGEQEFKSYWGLCGCELLGHRIYVLPEHSGGKVLELDVITKVWKVVPATGDALPSSRGSSLVPCEDKLLLVSGQPSRLQSISIFDTVLLEWRKVAVSGDPCFATVYHASDYWESKKMLLINARDDQTEGEKVPNLTFQINVNTMAVRKLETKGPPPSRRYYHSSVLLEDMRRWVIICGQGPGRLLADLYFLDLHKPIPTWTRHAPFSTLRGVSVCSPVRIGSMLLIFGGVRSGLENTKACSYDLQSGDAVEGIDQTGVYPSQAVSSFQRVIKQNDQSLFFVVSQNYRSENRIYEGRVHMSNEL